MGGKYWSVDEERYFWRIAIPFSPKRLGINKGNLGKSWEQLADDMQRAFGEDAPREYTGTMLCKSPS